MQQAIASLSARDRKVKPTSGDGNCLFHALAFVLYGTEMCHEKVYELLVQFVLQNQDRTLIGDFERYLSHVRCTKVWGTAVEILATVSLLQIPVPNVNTYNGSIIILSVEIGLLSHPKIHHLNSCLVLSFLMSENATMTVFYYKMEIIY